MYKHILIPTDGSPLSEKAVRAGIDLARAVHAQVTLLTASVPFHAISSEGSYRAAGMASEYARIAEERATRRFNGAEAYAQSQGVSVRSTHVYSEFPHEAIIDAARREGCDLVCMASHGRRGVVGVLVGSETAKVLTHSKVPVLVCR